MSDAAAETTGPGLGPHPLVPRHYVDWRASKNAPAARKRSGAEPRRKPLTSPDDIPYGFCHCGCGQKTKLAPQTHRQLGWVKDQPIRYLVGHATRGKRRPPEERFWEKVQKGTSPTDCWLWLSGKQPSGYGNFLVNPETIGAHVYAYRLLKGPVPKGLELDHLCRNPSCVNPAHLEPVTHRENCLRGEGISARHARKTHCPKGHEYSQHPKNPNWRICPQCKRDYARESYERRKLE